MASDQPQRTSAVCGRSGERTAVTASPSISWPSFGRLGAYVGQRKVGHVYASRTFTQSRSFSAALSPPPPMPGVWSRLVCDTQMPFYYIFCVLSRSILELYSKIDCNMFHHHTSTICFQKWCFKHFCSSHIYTVSSHSLYLSVFILHYFYSMYATDQKPFSVKNVLLVLITAQY